MDLAARLSFAPYVSRGSQSASDCWHPAPTASSLPLSSQSLRNQRRDSSLRNGFHPCLSKFDCLRLRFEVMELLALLKDPESCLQLRCAAASA